MERELWTALYWLAQRLGEGGPQWRYSTTEIVAVYLWAVVNDRPTSWAAKAVHWPRELRPARLPPQCTLSRRLRKEDVVALMQAVEAHFQALLAVGCWVWKIDGKALAVSPVSKDRDAGIGLCCGSWLKGYKLHAIWGTGPLPLAWKLTAMNASEKRVARELMARANMAGYLLGDAAYDVGALYDLAAEQGCQMVAKKTAARGRGGLGHRRQSPGRLRSIELLGKPFGQALLRQRSAIEGRFGAWASCGGGLAPLPAWVRRYHRVRNWVHGKLLAAAARWQLNHPPPTLANA